MFKFTFFFRHGFGGADVVFQHRAHRDGTEFTEQNLAALRALYASPMAVRHWSHAADSQRFAFRLPSVNCELIKEQCADQNTHGYAKVAFILEVAAVGLRMNPAPSAIAMLHTLKTEGRLSSLVVDKPTREQ